MIEKKEKRYFRILEIVLIFLLAISFSSLIYLFVAIGQDGSISKNLLELFYLAVHIVILCAALFFNKDALKRGSNVIRSLTYSRYGNVSIPARAISIIFFASGLTSFIYGLLILLPTGIYDFQFPIALKWDLLNVGLTVASISIFFFLFPFLFGFEPKKTK